MNKPFIKSVKGIAEVTGLDGIGAVVSLFVTLCKSSETFQSRLEEYKEELEDMGCDKQEIEEQTKKVVNQAFIIATYDTVIFEEFDVKVDDNCESIFNGMELEHEDAVIIQEFINKKLLFDQYVIRRWEKKGCMYDKFDYQ